jgi:hypothetical protein
MATGCIHWTSTRHLHIKVTIRIGSLQLARTQYTHSFFKWKDMVRIDAVLRIILGMEAIYLAYLVNKHKRVYYICQELFTPSCKVCRDLHIVQEKFRPLILLIKYEIYTIKLIQSDLF